MEENPPYSTTRIYIQNLNGIGWNKDGGKWPYICEVVETIQADVACFSEINVDTNNHQVRSVLESITQKHFQQNRLVMSSSRHITSSAYKPGGTAILASHAIVRQIQSHTRDRMGRWTSVCISSSNDRKVRVISAYQVCQTSRRGANTAFAQQSAQIIEESAATDKTARTTPREAFITELQAFIRQIQRNGELIVLVGDFNETLSSSNSGMERLATSCGLIDMFSVRTGSSTLPATYQRGKSRIDYALLSPELMGHIRAAGYEPFGYRIPSDHRGMFIDFDSDLLFHQPGLPIPPPGLRDFTSTTPGVVQKYVTAKVQYLTDHRFFERMAQLDSLQTPNHDLAEALDRDMQRAAIHGARQVTRRRQTAWSPKLAEVWSEIHFFKLAKTAATTTGVNCRPALTKLQDQWTNLPRTIPTDMASIQQGYNEALKKMKIIRQQAQTIREEFLLQKAALYNELQAKGKARVIQRLMRAESQQKVYKKIQYLRTQDSENLGINTIKIPKNIQVHDTDAIKRLPDTDEHWESITLPSEIERMLLTRNRHHFGQAEGTPFTIPPIIADLGYKADGYSADMILQGNINYEAVDEATALFIRHLQTRTTTQLSGKISADEVLGKLKTWKETTTTSPSGVHLGHYHCMWRDPRMSPDDPEREEIIRKQTLLLQATVQLLNYSLRHGYSFHRWSKIVNVMLQKDPGNPRIHRLRIIHIYEADYNLLLAVKWRQAMHHAEDARLLNEGLYGSRPGRSAHDPALLDTLQNEVYRMSMKPGISFDLDATSCYDRILANVAALSSRRMGMDKNVVLVNSRTLEQARYHLKTNLGVSEEFYQHCDIFPIHGTGQGSGNSPIIWCFVCDVLFDAFAAKAHGANFTSYDRTIKVSLFMVGFVDDCSQRVNEFDHPCQPPVSTLIQLMRTDAQLWNDLLRASGGALEQSKCSYYLIQTDWNDDGHPFLKGGTSAIPIVLHQSGTETPTWQKSNYESHKTLGCYVNPAYALAKTWSQMRQKNEGFAQLLESNAFSRSEAWTFYSAVYLPSMLYPLCITPLSKVHCQSLDSRFLRSLIPRCGYNRNMAKEIRYAPVTMGGAGFRQVFIEQGASLIQQVYKWLNTPRSQLGRMMYIAISWTQAFIGTSRLFLTDVHQKLPPVGASLLLDTMLFLREINGTITHQNPPIPPRLRQNDKYIMEEALNQPHWKPKHLSQINACRRFLQAVTLADVATAEGTRLLQRITSDAPEMSPSNVRISTFHQRLPGKSAWKTWKKFLRTMSDKNGILKQPLGKWTVRYDATRHWPKFVHDPVDDRLFTHSHGSLYHEHIRVAKNIFQVRHLDTLVSATGFPTAITAWKDTITPSRNYIIPPSYIDGVITIPSTQLPWEQLLLQETSEYEPDHVISNHIASGNIISCSDGSVSTIGASFGFIISTRSGSRLARGKGPAPGGFPNSFRSEAYGVLAAMQWLYRMSDGMQTARHRVRHYLDNQSVISRINKTRATKWQLPNARLLPEQDVIDEIVSILSRLPVQVEFTWIKGHQDSTTPYHLLSLPAQLNCDADQEASAFTLTHPPTQLIVPPLPTTPCQVAIGNKSVTGKIKWRVREAATIPPLFSYMQKKFLWSKSTISQVDWENYSHTLRQYKTNWSTIVKHCYGISPTGSIAHRNNRHLPHECPTCGEPNETNQHVILCPHPSRAKWRDETCSLLQHYAHAESNPYLLDILRDGLMRFHRNLDPPTPESYPQVYHLLIKSQNDIGWDQLYQGRWSIEWVSAQAQYSQRHPNTSKRTSGHQWLLKLSRLMIDQWMKAWKKRNEDRHGMDIASQIAIREQIILSQLEDLYQYKSRVCPHDRHIFYSNPREHMVHNPSLDAIENWINIFKPAILASVEQAHRLGIQSNRLLNEYPMFSPIAITGGHASSKPGASIG